MILLSELKALLATAALICLPAHAVDWSAVKNSEVTLFYPGQASWEFVLIPSTHGGAKKFRGGESCRGCHDGEQADMGALLVSGEKLEPDPLASIPGHINLNVAFAVEDDNLLARFSWQVPDGEDVGDAAQDARISLMIGDPSVKEAVRAGCWGGCHSDVRGMPDDLGLAKYLAASRTKLGRTGGGENVKPAADLEALMAEGHFLEIWSAALTRDQPASVSDAVLLDAYQPDEGDTVSAVSSLEDGRWTVTLTRPLNGGHKPLTSGMVVPVGFALHTHRTDGRRHLVSFEYTLAIESGEADFVAAASQ